MPASAPSRPSLRAAPNGLLLAAAMPLASMAKGECLLAPLRDAMEAAETSDTGGSPAGTSTTGGSVWCTGAGGSRGWGWDEGSAGSCCSACCCVAASSICSLNTRRRPTDSGDSGGGGGGGCQGGGGGGRWGSGRIEDWVVPAPSWAAEGVVAALRGGGSVPRCRCCCPAGGVLAAVACSNTVKEAVRHL